MKILKQGKEQNWWTGRKFTCDACKTQFQLETQDSVQEQDDWRDGNYAVIKCPTCKKEITFTK